MSYVVINDGDFGWLSNRWRFLNKTVIVMTKHFLHPLHGYFCINLLSENKSMWLQNFKQV